MQACKAEIRRRIGGVWFTLTRNLVIGTHTGDLITGVRIEAVPRALAQGATPRSIGGSTVKAWIFVTPRPADLSLWVDLSRRFNRTLPPEAARQRSQKA